MRQGIINKAKSLFANAVSKFRKQVTETQRPVSVPGLPFSLLMAGAIGARLSAHRRMTTNAGRYRSGSGFTPGKRTASQRERSNRRKAAR